jgi:hypothetical protein
MGEEVSIREEALELVRRRGPICDSEGFYQHTGECYSDATQMAFLFADGIKEIIQPALLALDVDALDMEPIFDEIESARRKRFYLERIPEYKLFLKHLQNRLARHIVNEYERVNSCPVESPINVFRAPSHKRRVAGANAFATIGGIKGITAEEYRESPDAFKKTDLEHMLFILNKVIFTSNPVKLQEGIDDKTVGNMNAVIMTSAIYESRDGHALAWYECGGEELMYEDNNGPFLFPWKKVVRFLKGDYSVFMSGELNMKNDTLIFKTGWYPIVLKRNIFYTFIHGVEEPIEIKLEMESSVSMEQEVGEYKITFTAPPYQKAIGVPVKEYLCLIPSSPAAVAPGAQKFRHGARRIRTERNLGGGGRTRHRRSRGSRKSVR